MAVKISYRLVRGDPVVSNLVVIGDDVFDDPDISEWITLGAQWNCDPGLPAVPLKMLAVTSTHPDILVLTGTFRQVSFPLNLLQ